MRWTTMVADEDSTGGAEHDLSHAWGYLAAADDVELGVLDTVSPTPSLEVASDSVRKRA
jgi:hypothetical protein